MRKIVVLLALTAFLSCAGTACAWVFPPVVVPFDSVVAPAPVGLPPLRCAPISQGPWNGYWFWAPGPFVDGYDLGPTAFLPPPLMVP